MTNTKASLGTRPIACARPRPPQTAPTRTRAPTHCHTLLLHGRSGLPHRGRFLGGGGQVCRRQHARQHQVLDGRGTLGGVVGRRRGRGAGRHAGVGHGRRGAHRRLGGRPRRRSHGAGRRGGGAGQAGPASLLLHAAGGRDTQELSNEWGVAVSHTTIQPHACTSSTRTPVWWPRSRPSGPPPPLANRRRRRPAQRPPACRHVRTVRAQDVACLRRFGQLVAGCRLDVGELLQRQWQLDPFQWAYAQVAGNGGGCKGRGPRWLMEARAACGRFV